MARVDGGSGGQSPQWWAGGRRWHGVAEGEQRAAVDGDELGLPFYNPLFLHFQFC